MTDRRRAALLAGLMFVLVAWTFFFYRATYNHTHRLRVVDPGKFYRAGQLTAAGFTQAVHQLGLRTIINVQDDYPDPLIYQSYLDRSQIRESELCKKLGVEYIWLPPDLVCLTAPKDQLPNAVGTFLDILDDPKRYPILLHCKAGLHRTGLLSAIYRMEYQGWSRDLAHHELRLHGFGDWASTRVNPYIDQYLVRYRPRARQTGLVRQPSH